MNNIIKIESISGDIYTPIIDTYAINEKPVGKGFIIDDAEAYECLIERLDSSYDENIEDYVAVKYFDNDLPYYIADSFVIIVRKDGETFRTNEGSVIKFSEHEVFMLDATQNVSEKLQALGRL